MPLDKFNTSFVTVKEIIPHIYQLEFTNHYDCAMYFLRFQEYYESPKFFRQSFTLVDYMEWYAKEYNKDYRGCFTYPRDWSGFNVPSHCLIPFIEDPKMIPDKNKYDEYMCKLIEYIKNKEEDHSFYFIGTTNEPFNALKHEIAHAFYTTDIEYRNKVDKLLHELPLEILEKSRERLSINNYHESTIDDEIHAYSATGLTDCLSDIITDDLQQPFIELFDKTIAKYNITHGIIL